MRCWFPVIWVSLLTACGGGGGSSPGVSPPPPSPPPPPATTGRFKDANVSGLSYATPSRSGVTGANGEFQFGTGEDIVFSVGGVTLGTVAAQSTLTPIHLVAGGSVDSAPVVNRSRFLMMLDQNADPEDGIAISAEVQQFASNWSAVDFDAADFANELVTIISDVASVDERTAELPDALEARLHLSSTHYCVASGFFIGTYSGDQGGTAVVLVYPSGQVLASLAGFVPNFESQDTISGDSRRLFSTSASDGSGGFLDGEFDSDDAISGRWEYSGQAGQFTATRRLPDVDASYRFVGQFFRGSVGTRLTGPLVLNVAADGTLTGDSSDVVDQTSFQATGTFDGVDFDYRWPDGAQQTGTADASLNVIGNGSTMSGLPRPWFAEGCRLN